MLGKDILPLSSPISSRELENQKELYSASTPYIERFVTDMRLSKGEMATGVANFIQTDSNYFSSLNFSAFRCKVAKVVQEFSSNYLDREAPKDYLFTANDVKEVWLYRSEEMTILQGLCSGPKDDTRLILFLSRMQVFAKEFSWIRSEHDQVIQDLRQLLIEYHEEKLPAFFEVNFHHSLCAEQETLEEQTQELAEENTKLTQEIEELEISKRLLEKENGKIEWNIIANIGLLRKFSREIAYSSFESSLALAQESNQAMLSQEHHIPHSRIETFYIKAWITAMNLNEEEISNEKLSNVENNFDLQIVSPFRIKVIKKLKEFISHFPALKGSPNSNPVPHKLREEVKVLHYLCKQEDDLLLILFIERMKARTLKLSQHNAQFDELINELKPLLIEYYNGDLPALFAFELNTSLLNKTEVLRNQNIAIKKENFVFKKHKSILKVELELLERKQLDLSNCGLDSRSFTRGIAVLPSTQQVHILNLSENRFDTLNINIFGRELKYMPNLTELKLNHCQLSQKSAMKAIVNGVKNHRTLNHIHLASNNFSEGSIEPLIIYLSDAQAVRQKPIQHWNLSGNPLRKADGLKLVRTLEPLYALEPYELNILSNGRRVLAPFIEENQYGFYLAAGENQSLVYNVTGFNNELQKRRSIIRRELKKQLTAEECAALDQALVNNNLEQLKSVFPKILKIIIKQGGIPENVRLNFILEDTQIPEAVVGRIRFLNGGKVKFKRNDAKLELETAIIQDRLLLWQLVCHHWHALAEAIMLDHHWQHEFIPLAKISAAIPKKNQLLLAVSEDKKTLYYKVLDLYGNPITKQKITPVELAQKKSKEYSERFFEYLRNYEGDLLHTATKPFLKTLLTIIEEKVHISDIALLAEHYLAASKALSDMIDNDKLHHFYDYINNKLKNRFSGLKVVACNLFELTPSALGNIASVAAGALSAAGVPGADLAKQGIITIDNSRRTNNIKPIAELSNKDSEYLATHLALQITLSYQWIIESLPDKQPVSSTTLLFNTLLNRQLSESFKIFAEFIEDKLNTAIQTVQSSQNYTYGQLANHLIDLIITEASGPDWIRELKKFICDKLSLDKVISKKGSFHVTEKEWLLSELCTHLAIVDAEGNYYVSPEYPEVEWHGYRYGTKAEAEHLGFKQVLLDFNSLQQKIVGFPGIEERFIGFLGKKIRLFSLDVNQMFKLFITAGAWLGNVQVLEALRVKLNDSLGVELPKQQIQVSSINHTPKLARAESEESEDRFVKPIILTPAHQGLSSSLFLAPHNVYQTSGGQFFENHEVSVDGNCGYTAFGIERNAACKLLQDNIHQIGHLLLPVIKEQLLKEKFIQYLIQRGSVNSGLLTLFKTYETLAQQGRNIDQVQNRLFAYVNDLNVINGYLDYDVKDKQIDTGWSHPCVLQALAHIRGIRLTIWVKGNDQLIPHEYYHEYTPPGATERKHLLFVNGNHFELLIEAMPQLNQNNQEKQLESNSPAAYHSPPLSQPHRTGSNPPSPRNIILQAADTEEISEAKNPTCRYNS